MKKIILLAAVISAATFASCKKDYTCVCAKSNPASGFSGTYTYDLGKIKKKDAQASCDAAGSQWATIGYSCEAKLK